MQAIEERQKKIADGLVAAERAAKDLNPRTSQRFWANERSKAHCNWGYWTGKQT